MSPFKKTSSVLNSSVISPNPQRGILGPDAELHATVAQKPRFQGLKLENSSFKSFCGLFYLTQVKEINGIWETDWLLWCSPQSHIPCYGFCNLVFTVQQQLLWSVATIWGPSLWEVLHEWIIPNRIQKFASSLRNQNLPCQDNNMYCNKAGHHPSPRTQLTVVKQFWMYQECWRN